MLLFGSGNFALSFQLADSTDITDPPSGLRWAHKDPHRTVQAFPFRAGGPLTIFRSNLPILEIWKLRLREVERFAQDDIVRGRAGIGIWVSQHPAQERRTRREGALAVKLVSQAAW